ncbi:SCO family protein [Polyangium fumosum]|uniref:SCO family protein n=2 Tax=Polyangium fumosum TaxID=889272 RepID=A0A4U1J395_9BACT|nr:SCO family protein [Polyangium fumosum]
MMVRPGRFLLFIAAALTAAVVTLAPVSSVFAGDPALPKELEGVDIEERPGALLPADAKLRDHEGRDVTLGSYLDGEHPVILVLAYYECPMLCSLVVNGLLQGMKGLAWTAGKEYRVVVVSIDPRDTPETARKKRDSYVGVYGRPVAERGWDFLVGEEAQARRVADAVGFRYRWEEATQQYAHAAGVFVFTPDGKLSRTLYGLNYSAKDLELSLLEASQGKLASAWGRVLLFCFHYDPAENKYVLATRRLMKAGGAFTVLGIGGMLLGFWRRERRRASKSTDGALA